MRDLISVPTVFIVGAGASRPYGIPTAAELTQRARSLDTGEDVYQLLVSAIGGDQLAKLLLDLREHPGDSIDAYLEHRQHDEGTMAAGKALLAALLGEVLANRGSGVPSRQWVRTVINAMSQDAPDWRCFANAARDTTFITFNFDSVIEDAFQQIIPKIYRDHTTVPADTVQVVHVHGRLAPPPTEPMRLNLPVTGYRINGVSELWVQWVLDARTRIHLVLDQIDSGLLDSVHTAIKSSTVLCFLGFSYHSSNLQKLGIPSALKRESYQHVFGSAYRLNGSARAQIEHRFGPGVITLGASEQDCLDLLNEYHVLRS